MKTETEVNTEKQSDSEYHITEALAKFELTKEESKLRTEQFKTGNRKVQQSKIQCTACHIHLGTSLNNLQNIYIHPLLKVLICKGCCHFYRSGDFAKDDDGTEIYCRWCGQGGRVVCCSKCPMVFCELCIKTNFSQSKYVEIKNNDDWKCFSCDSTQLINLKVQCYEFREYVMKEISSNSKHPNKQIDRSVSFLNTPSKRKTKPKTESNPSISKLETTPDDLKFKKVAPFETGATLSNTEIPQDTSKNHNINTITLVKPQTLLENETKKSNQPFKVPGQMVPKYVQQSASMNGNTDSLNVQNNFPKPFSFVTTPTVFQNYGVNSASGIKPILIHSEQNTRQIPPITDSIRFALVPTLVSNPQMTSLNQRSHILYRQFQPKVNVNNSTVEVERKNRHIEKAICESALTSSRMASDILQMSHTNLPTQYMSDYITVYNSLQESLNNSIVSLLEVQKNLNTCIDAQPGTPNSSMKQRPAQFSQPMPAPTFYINPKSGPNKENYHY